MSLEDRNWSAFMLDAECENFGHSRIASVHNALRARIAELEAKLAAAHKALDAWEASMYGKCVCKYAGDCDIRGCEINEARRLTAEAWEWKS